MKKFLFQQPQAPDSLDVEDIDEEIERETEQELAIERRVKGPEVFFWNDIKNINFPEIHWRIEGLIPAEGLVMLAATSSSGKTWLSMEMARCIASGENFLKEDRFKINQTKVLYIDAENQLRMTRERGELLGFDSVEDNLFISSGALSLYDSGEVDQDNVDKIVRFIKKERIKVVFIDTLRAVAGGLEEQKAGEVRKFLNAFREIARKGITVIFLEHLRKPSMGEGNIPKMEQVFSSMDKVASLDVLLMLKKELKKMNPNETQLHLYQPKNRFIKEVSPFKIIMTDEVDENFDVVAIKMTHGGEIEAESDNALEKAKEAISGLMTDGQQRLTKEIIAELNGRAGLGVKNIRWALSELVFESKLSKSKRGKENLYSNFKPQEASETPSLTQNNQIF